MSLQRRTLATASEARRLQTVDRERQRPPGLQVLLMPLTSGLGSSFSLICIIDFRRLEMRFGAWYGASAA